MPVEAVTFPPMTPGYKVLEGWFRSAGRALLGYSGGVDSTLLAVVGARVLGPSFLAVIGRSASYPEAQWRWARAVAEQHRVPLLEIDTEERDDPAYRSNPLDRCYYCKRELWSKLARVARSRGFDLLIDGTNADDRAGHRPGLRAGSEVGVRSPLVELGWTKADVRRAARELGIAGWDAPASPCLASRLRFGLEVTPERLRQVESAEAAIRELGVRGDLRVRHHGRLARVEVAPEMFPLVDGRWNDVTAALRGLGFDRVERDPIGYRSGSLLPA